MDDTEDLKKCDLLGWVIPKIDQFLKQHPHITPARLGHLVLNDTALVKRLREGGDVTTRKFCVLQRFFTDPDFQSKILNPKEKSNE